MSEEEKFITSPKELLDEDKPSCENCNKKTDKIETLTLCPDCFDKLSSKTQILFLENIVLKILLDKYKGEKNG